MKKRHDFAFDVSALPAYVNQESEELLEAAVYDFKTGSIVSWQEDIKLTDALHYLNVSPTRQAGTCSLTADGDAVLTQKTITVANLAYKMEFCNQDLIPKWTQRRLPKGSNAEDEVLTFGAEITSQAIDKIRQDNELTVWQGDTGSGVALLAFFDGFVKHIDDATTAGTITAGSFVIGTEYKILSIGTTDFTLIGASANTVGLNFTATGVGVGTGTALDIEVSPIDGNTSGTTTAAGITNANAADLVNDMCDAIPVDMATKQNMVLFVGIDTFKKYTTNMKDLNLFHYDAPEERSDLYSALIPSKGVRLEGVPGLEGTDRMFLGEPDNFVIGTDMRGEYEQSKSWFNEDTDLTYVQFKYKLGTQIKFAGEIVQFTLV